ncbi:alpha/beta hydrolase family protein [Actinosynnema sp. NPDC053489]|uniref:alpha/beta hydrolase family protein n=1 Tax=Actinosynnema sp. NPDC053489 TaxID=3363916 RepID=UPI0037CACAC8
MLPGRKFRPALVLVASVAALAAAPTARAAPDGLTEQEITFSSGGLALHGTVIAPTSGGPHPAMVMVHGSGRVSRDGYREEAEAFARSGIVTLVYDKRPKRSRSDVDFELLADDALAAVRALRDRPDVDPSRTGLWGVSEGGWVVPIAAAGSTDVAFVVTVGAPGTGPERQQSWNLVNRLAAAGVSGSLVDTVARTTLGLLVGAGQFPEAGYDPGPVLTRVTQPVLALWGDLDRVVPGAESMRVFRESLDRGGNRAYALRSVPGADHTLRRSPDGFRRGDEVSPDYLAQVAAWVTGPGPRAVEVGAPARQERPSEPVEPGSPVVQLGVAALLLVAFAGFGVAAVVRRRPSPAPARVLAATGLLSVLGLVAYLGHLASSGAKDLGPVVLGRPLPWLGLQALAATAVVATALTALTVRRSRSGLTARVGVLLAGGVLFVPWAVHWGLLLP